MCGWMLTQLFRKSGLPKKTQFYVFFDVTDTKKFRAYLNKFTALTQTVDGVLKDCDAIKDHKRKKLPGLVPIVGVNIMTKLESKLVIELGQSWATVKRPNGFVKLGVGDTTLGGDEDPFKTLRHSVTFGFMMAVGEVVERRRKEKQRWNVWRVG